MKGEFPNVTSIFIELSLRYDIQRDDTNVPLINNNVLKKMLSAFPRLTRIRFGHCLDPDTLLTGNFVKFFQALKQRLTYLSLASIHLLTETHVAMILKYIGSSLDHLEIFGGGINGENMFTGSREEKHNVYNAITTHCRQLQNILLANLKIQDLALNLGKVLDLEETLTVLTLQQNSYLVGVDGDFETGGIDAELAIAGLFVSKGKNLERFECDFRWEQSGGTALNNLVALQRSGVKPSTGADIGGDNCITDEGASQKGMRLRIANVGRCPIATICAAVSDGVQTIGIREYARGPTLDEIRTHFHENGDSIPSGATLMLGKREYGLHTGELT